MFAHLEMGARGLPLLIASVSAQSLRRSWQSLGMVFVHK